MAKLEDLLVNEIDPDCLHSRAAREAGRCREE
jgi:hypothetical protein